MNVIQVTKPSGKQWNQLLDAVVTIIKYKKRKLIMISTSNSSLMDQCPITVYTDDVLNTTNN